MRFTFTGELWYWRGPSPWHFVTVPPDRCEEITQVAADVTYGWGMIPATVTIGETEWTTSLWPKQGSYIVPIKKWVQDKLELDIGDAVTLILEI